MLPPTYAGLSLMDADPAGGNRLDPFPPLENVANTTEFGAGASSITITCVLWTICLGSLLSCGCWRGSMRCSSCLILPEPALASIRQLTPRLRFGLTLRLDTSAAALEALHGNTVAMPAGGSRLARTPLGKQMVPTPSRFRPPATPLSVLRRVLAPRPGALGGNVALTRPLALAVRLPLCCTAQLDALKSMSVT